MQHPTRRQVDTTALWVAVAVAILLLASTARGVQVEDFVRLKGSETNRIVGMGLVVGLAGTGDGGKFAPAMRPLAEVIGRLIDPNVVAAELKDSKNVALVTITAELPAEGVREGDRVDVKLASVGPASSLEGGRLFMIPMTGPLPGSPVFAFAEGELRVEDENSPTTAVIHRGAQLTRDVLTQTMDRHGRVTLVLNEPNASWTVANNLANLINGLLAPDGPDLARAVDAKNVLVQVPEVEQQNPAAFISSILKTYMDPTQVSTGARVVINERTGTIIMSGDVQVSPVVISHKGLTITTLTPEPVGTPFEPVVEDEPFVGVDPERRGGARLADLLAAFNQLKVEAEDRIQIIKTMHESGKLHAKLILE